MSDNELLDKLISLTEDVVKLKIENERLKVELKYEIEQKPSDEEIKETLRTEYEKGRADVIVEMQKPTWSEEDEEIVEALDDYTKNLDIFFSKIKVGDKDILSVEFREKVQHWLKTLKCRVQP